VYFVLLGETDMFVLDNLFGGSIECQTQVTGRILSALEKPDNWLVVLCMGGINCHALCIVGVVLGNGCVVIFGLGDAVVKEQINPFFVAAVVFVFDVLVSGNYLLHAVLLWA
jgi:hypothetical protein